MAYTQLRVFVISRLQKNEEFIASKLTEEIVKPTLVCSSDAVLELESPKKVQDIRFQLREGYIWQIR